MTTRYVLVQEVVTSYKTCNSSNHTIMPS